MLQHKFAVNTLLHLKHLLMYCISTKKIFFQNIVCPLTKANTLMTIYTKADGYNHIKIIVIHITCNHTIAFFSNCSEFPNSCRLHQFSLLINISNVLTNISFTRTKKFNHLSLRKPYRIFFYFYLKRNAFIWLIEHYLRFISSCQYFVIVVCHNHTFLLLI